MFKLSEKSKSKLQGLHPDLVKVVNRAIELTPIDFTVLEGLRTKERQQELFDKGASKTLNSRHLTGHAVDLAPYPIDWNDLKRFNQVADVMKQAAKELNVSIVWGGDWKLFNDCPHFELDKKVYP